MKIRIEQDTVRVSEVAELGDAGSSELRHEVRAATSDGARDIEIDLAQTSYIDSSGLGALLSLKGAAEKRNGTVRLLNAQPAVAQILELARIDWFMETGGLARQLTFDYAKQPLHSPPNENAGPSPDPKPTSLFVRSLFKMLRADPIVRHHTGSA